MSIRIAISQALSIDDASKPLLYRQIYESSHVRSANYLLDLVFAAGIATLGLVLNSPAVVIGAMLISPLMGPILAAGLAFAASDIYLGIRSLISLVISIGASIFFSAILVWMLPFQSPTSEILGRTQPNLLDLGVALFSGLAGSIMMARSLSGGAANALPGVAIAVALMPPLCTVGFGVGSGWNLQIITGAGLLFLTNLIAIAGSAFIVFYLVSMDEREVRNCITPRELRRATGPRLYALLRNAGVRRMFGDMGQLRWRLVMVAVTLAILFVPLRQSLNQLKEETVSRGAAREIVRGLMPADALLSQQLELFSDRVLVHLVSTVKPDQEKLKEAEIELARRTGKSASIDVRRVADETELVNLRERLRAPAGPRVEAAKPTLASFSDLVRPMVEGQVKSLWPESAGELVAYEVGFAETGALVRLRYRAAKALDTVSQEAMRNALRQGLMTPGLETAFEWERSGRRR